jgi:hypothetical protein
VGHRPGTSGPDASGGVASSQVPPVLRREPVHLRPWNPTFVLEGTTVILKPCPEYEEERTRQLSVSRPTPAIGYPCSSSGHRSTPVLTASRRALPLPVPKQSKDVVASTGVKQEPPPRLDNTATEVISDSDVSSC